MASTLTPEQLDELRGETKQPTALGIVISFTILSFVSVALRSFARFFTLKNPGWDDYCIALSLAASVAMAACMIEEVKSGLGLHAPLLTLQQTEGLLKYLFASIFCYNVALLTVKLSILLQYRRLFSSGRRANIGIYIVMAVVVGYGTSSILTGIFTCWPVETFWKIGDVQLQTRGHCVNKFPLWFANGVLNIFTDICVATLPLPVIKSLQMPRAQKIALMCVFGLGWFVCVVSMLRLNALVVLSRNMADFSWYGPETAYWSCIEINVAILCACAPVLKPLVTRVFPRFGSGHQYGHSRGQGTSSGSALRLGSKVEVQHISSSRSRDPFGDERGLTETPTPKSKSEFEMEQRPAAPVRSKSKRVLRDERLRDDIASPDDKTIKVTTAISQEVSEEEMKTEQAARALYSKYARYPGTL